MLGVDNGQDTGDRLPEVVAKEPVLASTSPTFHYSGGEKKKVFSHLVELGARGGNLLDAELAELSLELAELLHQVILGLVPELDSLDLSRRLQTVSNSAPPIPRK